MQCTSITSSMVQYKGQRAESASCSRPANCGIPVQSAVQLPNGQHVFAVREEWMHYIGFNSGDFARAGNALALSECNVKYMRPLRTRDVFNSLAWVTKVSATSFHLYQELVKVEEDEQACSEEVSFNNLLFRKRIIAKHVPAHVCTIEA